MNNVIDKKVTVLMSVYKEPEEQLKDSIESILKQTYKNFEFLIINDGNNKELVNLIQQYNDDRINLINNDVNMGLEKCLNKGLKIASGDYIVRMDADDISYFDRIEKQLKFIEENPEYAIVSGRAEVFDEDGIYKTTLNYGEVLKKDLVKGNQFIHPTMIINKKYILSIGGYPEYRRTEDYAMVMNLYANGYKGYVMDDVLLKYRMDKNGYKKKKFKYRIIEMKVRFKFFKKMRINFGEYIYVLKPIFVGLIPKFLLKKYHSKR